MSKPIRIVTLWVNVCFGLTLSGCYLSNKNIFVNSTFNYAGEPVNIFDNIYKKDFQITEGGWIDEY